MKKIIKKISECLKIIILIFIFVKTVNADIYNNKFENFKIIKLDTNINKFFYDRNEHVIYIIKKEQLHKISKDESDYIIKFYRKDIRRMLANKKVLVIQTTKNKIIVIDKITGKIKWAKVFNERMFFKPLVTEKKLFLDQDGIIIFALDVDTGKKLWTYQHIFDNSRISTNGKILQDKKYLYYMYSDRRMLVLNKTNGQKKKSFSLEVEIGPGLEALNMPKMINSTAVSNGYLFITYENGTFLTLTPQGTVAWYKPYGGYTKIKIGEKFLITTDKKGYIKALSKFSGKQIWRNEKLKTRKLTKPVIYNKNLLIGDDLGFIHFINIKSGDLEKTLKISDNKIIKIFSHVSKNFIYLLDENEFFVIKNV